LETVPINLVHCIGMRIAIVHYWLLNMRGGERVVEALCRLLPQADIFTLFYEPTRVSPLIRSRQVTPSFLNPLRKNYRALLPLMPMAIESLDLRGYDLVISSESGPAKGVLTHSTTRHICYCHTPMRYLWDLYPDYLHEWTRSKWKKGLMAAFSNYLRTWDLATAARVDRFVANSRNVKSRIQRIYRRDADVIYPPVSVDSFYWREPEDYYLVVSELVTYKRIDQAVAACSASGRRLRIVGEGPEYRTLRKQAGPSVEFCGRVTDDELRRMFAGCRAFLQPGEEDFGIASVEAIASGKAVIALGRGGVLEVAKDGVSGFFYERPEMDCLLRAMERFEGAEGAVDWRRIRSGCEQFSEGAFLENIRGVIQEVCG